ncbi:hypothetical protein ACIO1C_34040 [Streptomyces sp. NPDC087420]|uniref:hypothetical protein n=1 Tax=Streptomyces sp. NPDC087420 TaxID=3365785 RepID=UPI003834649E
MEEVVAGRRGPDGERGGGEWEFTERWPLRPDHVTPVYVTLGTGHGNLPGVLKTMIRALHGERVNVVVTLGTNGDAARFAGWRRSPRCRRLERWSTGWWRMRAAGRRKRRTSVRVTACPQSPDGLGLSW